MLFKVASWALVVLAFCVLTGYKTTSPDLPVTRLQGSEALVQQPVDPHKPKLMSVIGTVTSVGTNLQGQTNIKLQADDGTPLIVTVSPTIYVPRTRAGSRIQVEGNIITPGVISLPNQYSIKQLEPLYSNNTERVVVKGELTYISSGPRGILANISQDDEYIATVFIPDAIYRGSVSGQHVTVTGYYRSNGRIYAEEVL